MSLYVKIAASLLGGALVVYEIYRLFTQRNQLGNQQFGSSAPDTARCVVCLQGFDHFSKRDLLTCRHPIHPQCATLLFNQRENSCPMCRQQIYQEVHKEQVEQPPLFPSDKD